MSDAHDNALIRQEQELECVACGSTSGQFHCPECPSVNAFEAGRIPHIKRETEQ